MWEHRHPLSTALFLSATPFSRTPVVFCPPLKATPHTLPLLFSRMLVAILAPSARRYSVLEKRRTNGDGILSRVSCLASYKLSSTWYFFFLVYSTFSQVWKVAVRAFIFITKKRAKEMDLWVRRFDAKPRLESCLPGMMHQRIVLRFILSRCVKFLVQTWINPFATTSTELKDFFLYRLEQFLLLQKSKSAVYLSK